MDEKLYDLCDWAAIEGIVYADYKKPHSILGPHITDDGLLINMFAPNAIEVRVKIKSNKKKYDMTLTDEEGFFSILLPYKKIPEYVYEVVYEDRTEEIIDIYSFTNIISEKDFKKFENGIDYKIYDLLGSHVMEVNNTKGTLFVVWAPNSLRVSVVGEFNQWNGKLHMMSELGNTGIFWIFIPGIEDGCLYKYEMKFKGDVLVLKSDPYARLSEKMPSDASIVCEDTKFQWKDDQWIQNRKNSNNDEKPMCIYELHLGCWKKTEDDEKEYYNYRELAPLLSDYVFNMGYTHIQLLPIMEHREDSSLGYNITGYYAPTSRYGTPEDFKYFIDYLHQKGIGVILEWNPSYFADDKSALADFDGSYLYDHMDPKKGVHPLFNTRIFNHGRPQVSNFLIANALFWLEEYHIDGLKINDVACMLYLDYCRKDNEWIPNMYGENENLESIEFLKHLNSIHSKRKDGTFIIAEDYSNCKKITDDVEDGGLGFDFKWNYEWAKDIVDYMKCDPLFRKGRHTQLTLSMLYHYSAKHILALSHNIIAEQGGTIISKIPGEYNQKLANLRALFGFVMTHPGKKLFFMGQDFAQEIIWDHKPIDWKLFNYDNHKKFNKYVKELNTFYKEHPALYKMDYSVEGFEWINDMDSDRSILSFVRKSDKEDETLLVIVNFTPVTYQGYTVGVPYKGRYKEIFNSDKVGFGGSGAVNPRIKNARPGERDGRQYYINVVVPPMGISVYSFSPLISSKKIETIEEIDDKTEVKEKKEVKKTKSSKTTTTRKTASKKSVTKKTESKKAEPKTVKSKKVEPKTVKSETVESKKVEPKKVESKTEESKKVELKKVELKKSTKNNTTN